jgi:hypothetical protein
MEGQENAMKEFEQQLRDALVHQPAPEGMKQRILAARAARRTVPASPPHVWMRMAAGFLVAAAVGSGVLWQRHQEYVRGEEAREQVMAALRVTHHALDNVEIKLAEHDARTSQQRRTR